MNKRESTKSDSARFDLIATAHNANSTEPAGLTHQTSGTAYYFTPTRVGSTHAGNVHTVTVHRVGHRTAGTSEKVIAKAVLDHLRFQRARGIVELDVEDVARALSLSVSDVKKAVANLRSHGVKLEG